MLHPYLNLCDQSLREKKPSPCAQIWSPLTIDVEGRVFPCCLALWSKTNPEIMLGEVRDSVNSWNERIVDIREKQLLGNFGLCQKCAYLFDQQERCEINFNNLKKAYNYNVTLMAQDSLGISQSLKEI